MSDARELAIVLLAKDHASAVLGRVHEKFTGLGEAAKFAAIGGAAIAAVGVAVVGSLGEMAGQAAEAAMQVRKLAMETGLSAEEASKLRYAGARLNIDTETLSKSFGILSKNIELNTPIFRKLHVEVVRAKDGHVDLGATIAKLSDRFARMPDGVEKTALALQLFGRGGKDLIPMLNGGSAGLAAMGDEAAKLGLVFSKEGTDSAFKFGQAQKDLGDRFEAVKNTIGLAVLPVLTQLIGKAVEIADVVMPKVIAVFKVGETVFSAIGEIIDVFTGKNKAAGGELRNLIGNAAEPLMAAVARMREGWEKLVDKVMPLIQKLSKFVEDHMDTIQAVIGTVMDTVTGILKAGWDAIVGIFDTFMLLLDGNWSGAWDKITETMRNLIGTLGGIALSLGQKIVSAILSGLGELKTMVGNAIGSALSDAINGIDFWVGPFHVSGRGGIQFSMPSFGGGGGNNAATTPDYTGPALPGFASGTPYVPRDMVAVVHRGEAIIPADQNRGAGADIHEIHLYLDGRDITASTQVQERRQQRRYGVVLDPSAV